MLRRSKHAGEDWDDYQDFTESNHDIVFQDNMEKLYSLIRDSFKSEDFLEILEIGCGNGVLMEKLAEKLKVLKINFEITMIEPHKKLGQFAYNRIIKNGFKINWIKSTAEKFFPSSKKFDLIICTRTIHHLDKTKFVIRELHKCVKEKSIIFLYDLLRPNNQEELNYWIERRKKTLDHNASLQMAEECLLVSYDEDEVKKLFENYLGTLEITEDWFKRWYYIL